MASSEGFSKLRAFLWPIHGSEMRRFLPMLLMAFLVAFNYNLLRATKDALVVPASGAEALPFIKVWAIVPMAFLMTFIFTRLSNKLSRERVFYTTMTFFVGFFFLFTFVLYPLRDHLHPTTFADRLQEVLPLGCRGLIAVFRNWTYTAFYVMAEMWSTMILSVLLWGFANDVTSVKDAKRYYGILGIAINFSGIISGSVSTWASRLPYNPKIPFGHTAWDQSLTLLNFFVVIAGVLSLVIFHWLNANGYGYRSLDPKVTKQEPTDIKMGMRKNFAYLAKSKYLIYIALIVFTYNIAINLVEVIWKDQVKQLYPNPGDFNAYMGQVLTAIGILATATSIFISGNVIRKFSWTAAAMVAPVVILVTGIGFFVFLLFRNTSTIGMVAAILGSTPVALCVFFGSLQNCLARASKYTLFDATKELAFIPLSKESKLKGKAAIDGVGSRLGKSGGSVIHQGLLMIFGTVSLSTPYVGLILMTVIGGWIFAVRALGKQFNALTETHETLKVPDDSEPAQVTS